MYRSMLVASLASLAVSQNTVDAVTQSGDGQVQAPTASVVATAAVPTSVPYSNPFTVYLTQTNEWGVITGMPTQPSVITSQPAVVTSQPISPAHSYDNSTTLHTSTTSSSEPTSETADASSTTGEATSSPSVAPLNGAETNRIAGAGLALVVVSIGFFML